MNAKITEETPSLVCDEACPIREHNVALNGQRIRKGDSETAGHMVVAGPGKP